MYCIHFLQFTTEAHDSSFLTGMIIIDRAMRAKKGICSCMSECNMHSSPRRLQKSLENYFIQTEV